MIAAVPIEAPIDQRPGKRRKVAAPAAPENEPVTVTRAHPLGVRPAGNAYFASINLKDSCGNFTAWLRPTADDGSCKFDNLIAGLLEYLGPPELLMLGATCRALHSFTRNDEIWRTLFTSSPPANFRWRGTWRSTLLQQDVTLEPRVDCSNLFSDLLHRPFLCSHVPLEPFVSDIPKRNQIPKKSNLTSAQDVFEPDRPVILTDVVCKWPAYRDWSPTFLTRQFGTLKFRAEAVDWALSDYVAYMRNNTDESPLYLFDSAFAEKMSLPLPSHEAVYWPPPCFGPDQDLFSVLGAQRPDHRWLIIGPARSGSTFHKDPNGTCAWNAVLRGRKYWILFPSSPSLPPPPGVFVSADGSEVTSPLSIAEWLLGFHAEARATPGCREGICEEGEMLYVPAGWYHLVLNLDESVALTQNFVPRHRLPDVLAFLNHKRDQVSGFKGNVPDPYGLFVDRLAEQEPELLREALEQKAKIGRARWDEIKAGGEHGETGVFSFGFGGHDDDDDDD